MKKVLITGANSYIGTSVEKYITEHYPEECTFDTIDMRDGSWKEKSFSGYDVVFHVAGIAHQKETKENAESYYKINRDLAVDVASKSKDDGVKQFIFLSSMSVYGMLTGRITRATPLKPKTNYGKSKLQAEKRILPLQDNNFKVCVLRPPMVYGDGCKGNYQSLINIVKKFPVFPRINNRRSVLYIDNLSKFVMRMIQDEMGGLFFPQDEKYMRTDILALDISKKLNKKLYRSFLLGFIVLCLRPFVKKVKKAFGSLVYDKDVLSYGR